MKLSSIFLGAALVWGAAAGPGVYHEIKNEPQTVQAQVTGLVDVPGNFLTKAHTEVHTTAGVFNTVNTTSRTPIIKGLTYDFNLRGAHITPWPMTYTRDITSAHLVTPLDNFFKPPAPGS
jgi:hypothetical protein